MTLRILSRRVALALALAALPVYADPSPAKDADTRVRSVERASAQIHRRLREARAARDSSRQAGLDDLLRQAGAAARRAVAARAEIVSMLADGRDPGSRLAELSYLDARARGLVRAAEGLDPVWIATNEPATVTVRVVPLPPEPQ